jgi:threonine dehydratase
MAAAHPLVPTHADVATAAHRIAPHIRRTPLLKLQERGLPPLILKVESLQRSGAFKARGAFNAILSRKVPKAGVIAASGGNHGAAVALAAAEIGHKATIFVPRNCPPVKIERLRAYGAEVVATGEDYADAFAASVTHARSTGALAIHAYDEPDVVAGQGTAAREFEEDSGGLDTMIVAVGGGGLVGGTLAWFDDGRTRVVGVESEGTATLAHALAAGRPVDIEVGGIAADALGARRIGDLGFALAQRLHRSLLVSDAEIAAAQKQLWEMTRIVAEPGAAAAFAAVTSGRYVPAEGERVGVLICGGNADLAALLD